MKIEVTQNARKRYLLVIDGETIMNNEKFLSDVVKKIEDYLKMRFLKGYNAGGLKKVLDWVQK